MSDGSKNSLEAKSAKVVAWLHGITFTLFSVFNIFIATFFIPWLASVLPAHWHEIFTQLLAFVLDVGLYAGIYFICNSVYLFVKFKKASPDMYVKGLWYHLHVPTVFNEKEGYNEDVMRNFLRAGQVSIKQTMFALKVQGVNYKAVYDATAKNCFIMHTDHEVRTEWEYNTASFVEEEHGERLLKIYACYRANSTNNVILNGNKISANRLGVHDLTIVPKDRIEDIYIDNNALKTNYVIMGQYLDTFPSSNKGKIYMFRTKEERDEVIKAYFEKYLKTTDNQPC